MEIIKKDRCFIVAEGGVAHHGHFGGVTDVINMAKTCGADAVKFQVYKTEEFISKKHLPKWFNRYKSKELSYEQWERAKKYADKLGVTFFATAHDDKSLDFLAELGVEIHKIGSGELGNWDFVRRVESFGKPTFASTGMYTKKAVEKLVKIFREEKNDKLVVMHCVTAYPTAPKNANMKRMLDIRDEFGVDVGYSDHTQGNLFPMMAVAMGAKVLEKHVMTGYETFKGNDWRVAAKKEGLMDLGRNVRTFESGLGKGLKANRIYQERFNEKWATKRKIGGKMLRA